MADHTHGGAQLGDAAHKVTSAVGGTVSGALDATGVVAKTALGVTGGAARKVVALTDKGPMSGFKKFISRGSMIDMAVGVVMGSAVTSVVNAIVDNLISPLIGMIGGVPDMSGLLTVTFNNSTISFGAIIDAVINFLLVGVAVYFCVILPINKLRDVMADDAVADGTSDDGKEPSVEEQTLETLREIRDELRRANVASAGDETPSPASRLS